MSVGSRLKNLLARLTVAPGPVAKGPEPDDTPREQWTDQLLALGVTPDDWLRQRRERGRLYADLSNAQVERLRQRFPALVERTRTAADRIRQHEFDLLGSGWCVPADRQGRSSIEGYGLIDWSLDPIQRLRFPIGFRHKEWNPAMRPGNADLKWPWEIGRCQHWMTLGQAFRLTGDDKYAAEIVNQHADFIDANPVGVGVQFVCTMDVAIRAFNWALAFELIRSSPSFDLRAMRSAYQSLFDLGVFIEGNLENNYEVTSNHFLSNIVGLYAVGLIFSDLPAGRRWLAEAREWVEQEMRVQVLDDGADYESSIPYHRLVAELFLGAARLAQLEGRPLSSAYLERLRTMIDFFQAVQRPDGLMPQVGDADDGRLHIFTGYGTWQPQDGRHLFEPAARFFDEPSWRGLGGDDGVWEAAWWGWDPPERALPTPQKPVARLFEHAGIAVVRSARSYLLVTNGRVGTSGFGNHKHNDLLSFEFHDAGQPLIVDPGSYLYTSKPDERNRFRSTAYHNTVQVDGTEQNELRLDYLFRMFETSTVEHIAFVDTVNHTEYRGRHTGYERLPNPVIHERSLHLLKDHGALLLTDWLRGSSPHALRWHFHIAPGVAVETLTAGDHALVTANGRRWIFRAAEGLKAAVSEAWYSPSFGVRVPCRAIDLTVTAELTPESSYRFAIGPEAWMQSHTGVPTRD